MAKKPYMEEAKSCRISVTGEGLFAKVNFKKENLILPRNGY